jgi:ABC-type transport system involved in multi-copper enzyme maturation permease subunit
MFWSIVRFEIRYHLKNPLLYITSGLMFLMAFGAITSDSVQVGGPIGQVHRNAPLVIINLLAMLSAIGLFIVTAFVASSIQRDFERGTHELFFSRPVGKVKLLLGRFSGSMVVSVLMFVGPILGIVCGNFAPWVDPERLGPVMLAPYVWATLVAVVPNLIFMGGVFFTFAALTRSLLATYMGVVGFMVAFGMSRTLLRDLSGHFWGALLDPFGVSALRVQARYWTIVEQNTLTPQVDGLMLANRLLWIGVGLAVLALGVWWFDPARSRRARRVETTETSELGLEGAIPATTSEQLPWPTLGFGPADGWRMLAHQIRYETVYILRSGPFLVMLLFAVVNVLLSSSLQEMMGGTRVLPVTRVMLEALGGAYIFILAIIVAFYAGESIWRDRTLKVAEVRDALPAPTWVFITAKTVALVVVIAVFGVVGVLATVGYQLYSGYTRLELGLYAGGVLLAVIPFVFCAVLAVFIQVLVSNKFLGYLVILLYLILDDIYSALDLDHNLYRFPFLPDLEYSDMNGWGHYLEPYLWYALYWAFLCVVLLAISALLWVRGSETTWRFRWQLARRRFGTPARITMAAGLIGFVATGVFIFYNTNIINEYLPGDERDRLRADYEREYRRYKDLPLPRITDVAAEVGIFPEDRRVEIRGRYALRNMTDQEITELHLSVAPEVTIGSLELPAHTVTLDDRRLGYRICRLDEPLPPDATTELRFELEVTNPGFVNNDPNDLVVANGTFFTSRDYFPTLGYKQWLELEERTTRRKHGLPPERRMAPIEDVTAYRNNELGPDADLVGFTATVSTSPDQIAIAPGYLQREWLEGGRRYFSYEMDAPIRNIYCFLSADWMVRRDRWQDVDIDVYYHAPHDANVERMISSVRKALDYFSSNFGPYQFRQVRILEFPRYRTFAMSLPNTIPYSEGIGFIAEIDDQEGVDNVMYITAHEVAHQWWAHQVVGADVQGANMITESLSQYSALMVMEHEYGRDMMREFLKYELDRYLAQRGREVQEEMPLVRVEQQPYIYYRKGSLVTYALRDYLGEEAVNRALARYVQDVAFQEPPYTTALEIESMLRSEAPPGFERLFKDQVDTITLYSNRVDRATWEPLDDGRYLVRMNVEARKVRSDGFGVETEIPVDDWIDVGVFGPDESVLYLEKRHVTEPAMSFEITVDQRPERAGIDPYNKLVDRDSDDNVAAVREG